MVKQFHFVVLLKFLGAAQQSAGIFIYVHIINNMKQNKAQASDIMSK